MQSSPWWREVARLYVRYLISCMFMLPAAIMLAYVVEHNLQTAWAILAVILGLIMGFVGLKLTERNMMTVQIISSRGARTSNVAAHIAMFSIGATSSVRDSVFIRLRSNAWQGSVPGEDNPLVGSLPASEENVAQTL